jgi:HSP20 family protein
MSVVGLGSFRDPFRESGRLLPMAASGTRAPLLMPMDVCCGKVGSYM